MDRFAYKLDVLHDWRVHLVFLVAQLKPAPPPTNDPFYCPHPHMPFAMFVNGDTNTAKSFEVDRLLNKQIVKKGKGYAIEYLYLLDRVWT